MGFSPLSTGTRRLSATAPLDLESRTPTTPSKAETSQVHPTSHRQTLQSLPVTAQTSWYQLFANHFRPHPVVPIAQLRHHVSHNQRLVPGQQHSSEQILRLPTQSQSQPPPLFPTTPFMRLVSFVASGARSGRAAGFIEWRRTPDCAADVWHVLWRLQVLRERRRLLVALEGHTAELSCTVNGFH